MKSIVEENSKKNDDEDDDDEAAPAAATEESSVKKKSKTPRRLDRHPESAVMNKIMFEQQAVLIKPNIDASDKELHMRNKFNHQSKNMEQFIQAAYKDSDFVKQVFKPDRLGQLSKNYQG